MPRLKIVLICLAGAAGVFGGGWVLGAVLGDSESTGDGASEEATVDIPTAVPLGYGEEMPDLEVLQELSETAPVAIPSRLVEPVPVDDGETPGMGAFRIAGTDVEPEGEDRSAGPLPPYEPLTIPLGEPDDDGEIEPSGFAVISDEDDADTDIEELVDLEELLGPLPDDPAADAPESGDDEDAPTLLRFGFFDLCAETDNSDGAEGDDDSGGLCPFGVGGTILPVDDRSDLPPFILGTLYDWTVSFTDHCDPLGWNSETERLHVLITSSAPGDFQMSYSPDPLHRYGDPLEVSFSTSEEEVERWHRLIAEGATHPRVNNCAAVDIPSNWRDEDVLYADVDGTDLLGRETARGFAISLHTMREMETRPPIRLEHRGAERHLNEAFFVVPYDPDVEQAWLAVIPVDGPRASTETCTDIENSVLDSSRPRDRVIANTYTARLQGRSPTDMANVSHAAVARITPEPGTTYRFCGWATRTGLRSFDRPFPVERNQIVATSPTTLSARISVTGGLLTMERDARDLQIQAVNWHHHGRPTPETTATAFADAMPVGEFTLDEPQLLFDGSLLKIPNETVLQISNTQGWSQSTIIPTPVRCDWDCPEPGAREYGVPLPGPGMSGWVRILVETEAGPAGHRTYPGFPYWRIVSEGVPTEFGAPEPRERPATPRIDTNASSLRAFGTGLEERRVQARLNFDRPVRIVEATPEIYYGQECGSDPETVESDEFAVSATLVWGDLCYDRTYVLSLLVEDEDGNQLDLRRWVDGVLIDDQGWGQADTAPIEVRSYEWEVQINRLDDWVGVHQSWFVGHPVEIAGGGFADWCMEPDEPRVFSGVVRQPYGRNLQWNEFAHFGVQINGWADGVNCGADDPRPEVFVGGGLSTFDLAEGEPITLVISNDRVDATITISNVVLAR